MATDTGTTTSIVYSLAPMVSIRNGARAVEFYKSAFGAIEVYRMEDPGGSVVARLAIQGAEFWVADESPDHQTQPRVAERQYGSGDSDRAGPGCDVRAGSCGRRARSLRGGGRVRLALGPRG